MPGVMYKLCMRHASSFTVSSNGTSTTSPTGTDKVRSDDDADVSVDGADQKWSTVTLFIERKSKLVTTDLI